MKVIMSPSKEQSFEAKPIDDMKTLPFFRKTKALVERIQKYSKEDLAQIMGIKGMMLDQVYETYSNFGHTGILPAIQAYTGIAFRQMDVESYSDQELYFMEDSVRILSAMYGMVTPLTGISRYRLDMKMKVLDASLYAYWKEEMSAPFSRDETIVNLASKEFSKMIKMPMITVEFKEKKGENLRVISTNAKKARGQMVEYIVRHKIDNPELLKRFNNEGWQYDNSHSDDFTYVFVREG